MTLPPSRGIERDRVDTHFVEPLVEIFKEKIEKNLEKSTARDGRSKFQNFQHLISKLVSPDQSNIKMGVNSAVLAAKGITAGVSGAISLGPIGTTYTTVYFPP